MEESQEGWERHLTARCRQRGTVGTTPLKVVLDTNVLISALLWRGSSPTAILERVRRGSITLCVSKEILDEVGRVLHYPKFRSRLAKIHKTPETLLSELGEIAAIYPSERLPLSVIDEDPSDNKFLSCAVVAQAQTIVSGDQHLLDLERFQGILIQSPRTFLQKNR